MSELKATEYKKFEDIKHIRADGSEYWSARELAIALDYTQWRNFSKVIGRAMIACENSGHSVTDDFPEVRKIAGAKGIKNGAAPTHIQRRSAPCTVIVHDSFLKANDAFNSRASAITFCQTLLFRYA